MKNLNILILTWLGNPTRRRKAVEELEFRLPLFAPEHNYLIHDFDYPVTEEMKSLQYDFIYIGPTFLCFRNRPDVWQILDSKYDFIRDSEAVKFAFPQDDYYCSLILDEWFSRWNIDALYTILPNEVERFFPQFARSGKPIIPAYTGYISQSWIANWYSPKEFDKRSIDISYRANKAWPNVNRLAQVKADFAEIFLSEYHKHQKRYCNIDVSTDNGSLIAGDAWHAFLEDSKFCLATRSGCDHNDPYGEYKRQAHIYSQSHVDATFDDVRRHVNIDSKDIANFTMISPRNIEAGLSNTVQLAVAGDYNNLLKPDVHYIPIREDCRDIAQVMDKMDDKDFVQRIAAQCKEALLSQEDLRIENHVDQIITLCRECLESRNSLTRMNSVQFLNSKNAYWNAMLSLNFKPSIVYPEIFESVN